MVLNNHCETHSVTLAVVYRAAATEPRRPDGTWQRLQTVLEKEEPGRCPGLLVANGR